MNRLTTLSVLVLFFCSCFKKPEQSDLSTLKTQNADLQMRLPEPASADATYVAAEPEEIKAVETALEKPKAVKAEPAPEKEKKAQEWLAELADHKNNVNFRARTESIWKPVDNGMGFIRFDALQTQASSNAKVMYKSGASLDVKQNTLLIFDYDPGKDKKNEDRVIMSKGELVGSTKTELWIFTKSGLVQIKSETGKKAMARARVVVAGPNKLNLKVEQGNAEVVYKKQNEFKRVKVIEKSEIELRDTSSIVDIENFNESRVIEQVRQVAQAETEIKKTVKAQIEIANLEDGIVVESSNFEVKGKLTAEGGTLLINGDVASLDQDLKFTKTLNLQMGVNLIVFQIVRSDGTVEFVRRNIRLKAN